jgi:hypothetical protein
MKGMRLGATTGPEVVVALSRLVFHASIPAVTTFAPVPTVPGLQNGLATAAALEIALTTIDEPGNPRGRRSTLAERACDALGLRTHEQQARSVESGPKVYTLTQMFAADAPLLLTVTTASLEFRFVA